MTDSSILATQNAAPLLDTSILTSLGHPPPPSPIVYTNGHITQDDGDAEEGAIKCICSNPDDDGNTVMCDKCETWQHIVCYYADRISLDDDDSHFCVDCLPRAIDAKAADERQKAARVPLPEEPSAPRRSKPGPKKKSRKADASNHNGTNGLTNGHGSPRNGAEGSMSSKRRGGHRPSASTSNIPLKIPTKRSPNSSVQSPLKSPHSPPIPSDPNKAFSPEFMHLYKNDSGEDSMAVSQFEDLKVPTLLADWSRNPNALASVTNGKSHDDIFMRINGVMSDMAQVPLAKHRKEDRNITAHGTNPQWIYITAERDVGKDSMVGELIGRIGSMTSYIEDAANRWEYLRHPLPFVFFHPQLPIVIDTREEGSIFRYLRRSCEPNLTIKTILNDVSDYHFCFTANREVKTGTELTIPWTLDEHVRRFFLLGADVAEVDEEYVSNYTRRVLAEFGGCACNSSQCVMANWAGWTGAQHKSAKSRKKTQRAFGSRSSSEAVKQAEEDEMEDATAASTSSRSKQHSRDNTPSSMVDAKNIISADQVSEREKRKIEALERSASQPNPKKTKRKSADNRHGNPPPTPGASKRGSLPDRDFEPPAPESVFRAGLKTSPSPLPTHSMSAPPLPKPTYSEIGCQADLDCSSLTQSLPSPTRIFPKRSMSSLHRRVFRKSVLKSETESPKASPLTSPETEKSEPLKTETQSEPPQIPPPEAKDAEGDVPMIDAPAAGLGISGAKIDPPSTVDMVKDNDASVLSIEDSSHNSETKTVPLLTPILPDEVPQVSSSQSKLDAPTNNAVSPALEPSNGSSQVNGIAKSPEKSPKEQALPTLALHLSKEADAAATPKKKKINLTQYLARRNSSNVSIGDNDGDNSLSAKLSKDATRSLSPLKEELRDSGADSGALETPKTENGDPMIMA